jgi:hypothetical protein
MAHKCFEQIASLPLIIYHVTVFNETSPIIAKFCQSDFKLEDLETLKSNYRTRQIPTIY